jgi:hypothetical protein
VVRGLSEPAQGIVPKAVQKLAEGLQALRANGIEPSSARRLVDHQAGILQDPEVLADSRARDGEAPGDLHHRSGPIGETEQDQPAGAVTEGIQDGFRR